MGELTPKPLLLTQEEVHVRAAVAQPLPCGRELCLQRLPSRLRRCARGLLLPESGLDANQASAAPGASGLCLSMAIPGLAELSAKPLEVRRSLLSERLS